MFFPELTGGAGASGRMYVEHLDDAAVGIEGIEGGQQPCHDGDQVAH